jgi:hypothetical protein
MQTGFASSADRARAEARLASVACARGPVSEIAAERRRLGCTPEEDPTSEARDPMMGRRDPPNADRRHPPSLRFLRRRMAAAAHREDAAYRNARYRAFLPTKEARPAKTPQRGIRAPPSTHRRRRRPALQRWQARFREKPARPPRGQQRNRGEGPTCSPSLISQTRRSE